MGLFDFMRGLSFFQGHNTEGLTNDDVDFGKWVAIHRKWRNRLSDYIQGVGQEELDETVICRDDRCELGTWIHGSGSRFYGGLPVFGKLRDHHARFHRCAGDVVRIYKNEGRQAATKALHTEFDLASLKVVEHIESLAREVEGPQA
ncbi:MAG: CZB domain-containing protein [Gammaproteobacteria bacterium]|nr:CZB domain-containing protein [Gammaproteobacteria bacterium]MBU1416593.1 CZB domain-containing protein [Gammaproteobacteria bacterium]